MTSAGILTKTILLVTFFSAAIVNGDDVPAEENTELHQRIKNLEKKLQELEENKKPVWSTLDVQIYGYIKADASYDNSRTYPGNYVLWVDSEAMNKNDDEFNLTANQTRLGMKITGPKDAGLQTSGRIEFDFYGNYADENKAKIQMRHAYMQITWPDEQLDILAGQTSDVISPLFPPTLNYTVLWDAGNIGFRRPQIRLTKHFALGNDIDLELQGAIARTIGRDSTFTGSESGEDAGFPSLQGRAGLTFIGLAEEPTIIGLSGHWGQEEYDIAASGANKDFDSWSVNIDVTQQINDRLNIKGEFFTGENLNTYFGGIGQGVRAIKDANGVIINHANEIKSKGGWVALGLGPWDSWRFNIGAGIDDVDASDVNLADRTENRCLFGNAIYSINKNTEIGFELSHWRTEYRGSSEADSIRAQSSLVYQFK
jgi:hypothetical protein